MVYYFSIKYIFKFYILLLNIYFNMHISFSSSNQLQCVLLFVLPFFWSFFFNIYVSFINFGFTKYFLPKSLSDIFIKSNYQYFYNFQYFNPWFTKNSKW